MNNYNEDKFNENLKEEARSINIDVPDKLKNNILKTLDGLPDKKVKKKSKLEKISKIVATIIVCLLSFNLILPTYAESIPLIGPTFKSINEAIGIGDEYIKGSKNVNLTKVYDDTTMTIKNVYYDGVELAIAYELKSENGFDDKPIIFPIIRTGFNRIEYSNEENDGEFIDDNTYVGLASYAFTENELSDKSKIEFTVNDLYGNWVGHYPKKYKFKLSLNAENMGKETHNINKEINYEARAYNVKEVITSKLNTIIYVDILKNDSSSNSTENYRGVSWRYADKLRFFAIDDRGIPLETGSLSLSSNIKLNKRLIGNSTLRFSGASEGAKSITLIPFIEIYGSNNGIRGKINKENETVIKLETGEEYIIESINFEEDKTVLNIKAKQYLRSLENLDISFWSGDKEMEEDELSNNSIEQWDKGKNQIKVKDIKFNGIDDGYNFTLNLPALDSKKEYYFSAYNSKKIILENEKITIDLSK